MIERRLFITALKAFKLSRYVLMEINIEWFNRTYLENELIQAREKPRLRHVSFLEHLNFSLYYCNFNQHVYTP